MVYFEVRTITGKKVRTTIAYWRLICEIKHPIIKDYEREVKATLELPDEIRRSRKDSKVYLYYKRYRLLGKVRYICVLVKELNGEGFLISAYISDTVKKGVIVWQRK